MSDTFDSVAFLSSVSCDGDWSDEFLAWYEPDKWLSEERACGAFLARKFALTHRASRAGQPSQMLVSGATIYALNERGVNRWSAYVQPGKDDNDKRISDEECVAVARAIAGIHADPAIKRYTHCEDAFDSFEDADGEWVLYEDHCAALAAATPEPADDAQALRAFAQAVIGNWPDVGGLDGFDLQQLGVKHGLLKMETRYAPCSEEGCRCAEDADPSEWNEGVQCYRKTPLLTGATAIDGSIKP